MLSFKRFFTIFCVALFFLSAMPSPAFADVVWSNQFANENDIEPLNRRRFIVNSPRGYVTPQEEPGQSLKKIYREDSQGEKREIVLPQHHNGKELSLSHVYLHKREYWGKLSEVHGDNSFQWVPMNQLLAVYTNDDFMAENEDSFYIYTGGLQSVLSAQIIATWQWPGSDAGMVISGIVKNPENPEFGEVRVHIDDENEIIAFLDESGREWIYIQLFDYTYGFGYMDELWARRSHRWVCLADLEGKTNIPFFSPAPDPAKWSPEGVNWIHPYYEHRSPVSDPVQIAHPENIIYSGNGFYARNRSHILYLGRSFVANSDTGYVPVRYAPGLEDEMTRVDNGNIVFLEYSCLYDGEFWGLIAVTRSPEPKVGWVKLDDFLVLYDYVAFEEEHIDTLTRHSGNLDEIDKAGTMIAWSWPGSGISFWTVEGVNTSSLSIAHAYTDYDGREWGFIRYISNSDNIWVCTSDPVNPDIPAFNPAPPPGGWVSDTVHTDIAELNKSPFLLAFILVSFLAVSSVVLILVLWKAKRNQKYA